MVGFSISTKVTLMPLAIAAADSNASVIFEAILCSYYRRSEPDLVFRASTRFPLGHVVLRPEWLYANSLADRFQIALRKPADHLGDIAVFLHQEQRRN